MTKSLRNLLLAVGTAMTLAGCAASPPAEPENICAIFKEKRDWYKAAKNTREKWGAPEHVTMSIMYQESSFKHNAAPPMQYFLGFIPIGRASSAYGYAQAKTITWGDYVKETGNTWGKRNDFDDAMDFMGWYIYKSNKVNGVSKWDAYAQYLNYHEGWGGYKRGSYRSKAWLMNVSKKVDRRASQYSAQLQGCREDLDRSWLWRLFFG